MLLNLFLLKDTLKHIGLRKQLAIQLQHKGIHDENVLQAIKAVPRHLFLDSGFHDHAYQDKAFPIGAGQTISQPYTVAYQSQLLQLQPNESVLEIGTGSGYQTAVLLEMGARVFTIERQNELFKKTKLFFNKIGYRPKKIVFGDGYKGLPNDGPFARILVTAGAPELPRNLLSQLKIGGRLVVPIGIEDQVMTVYTRNSEREFAKEEHDVFRFVPLLENKN